MQLPDRAAPDSSQLTYTSTREWPGTAALGR
eukprot:CAMPEP_0185437216 /NCGR_PEP_ID=MMETSP1365-20130426/30611_1 /TAXON_ID=38817 /ORGANISM="Gephyrocapsa oceanica, Strain RCC1303" /LENGTH=30 /DNA_ID= /DNA_START= /DNA_END= /DNA_ORIENTATION=